MKNADQQKIEILNNKIMQWSTMQSELLNSYMNGKISKNEYKGKYNNLDKDINEFKFEIHELIK